MEIKKFRKKWYSEVPKKRKIGFFKLFSEADEIFRIYLAHYISLGLLCFQP